MRNKTVPILSVISLCLFIVLICRPTLADVERAREKGYESGYDEGFYEGYALGHYEGKEEGYEKGYDEGYDKGYKALKPVAMPKNGEILSGSETKWKSELTVTASSGTSCVVTVKDNYGNECVTFFVRSGSTVTMGVPKDNLRVYFASGSKWYGYGKGKMFGEETSYTKDNNLLDFKKYTWSYTLYPVANGNFKESPSSASEFFR